MKKTWALMVSVFALSASAFAAPAELAPGSTLTIQKEIQFSPTEVGATNRALVFSKGSYQDISEPSEFVVGQRYCVLSVEGSTNTSATLLINPGKVLTVGASRQTAEGTEVVLNGLKKTLSVSCYEVATEEQCTFTDEAGQGPCFSNRITRSIPATAKTVRNAFGGYVSIRDTSAKIEVLSIAE